jgi:hypothetical protein
MNTIDSSRIIFYFLWTGILFISCEDFTHYVENDRIPVLRAGDSIFFKSNENSNESYLITNVARKEFYTDGSFSSDYYTLEYNLLKSDVPDSEIYKYPYYEVLTEWDRSIIHWRKFYKLYMVNSLTNSKKINGTIYQNVIKLSIDTANLKENDVINVYYSDQQGVLSYMLKSGEYFSRVK